MKIAVLINTQARNALRFQKENFEDLAAAYNIENEIFLLSPRHFKKKLTELLENSYDAIVVGGGDGTINTAAQLMVQKNIPLAVLPLGTFNHFAAAIGITDNLEEIIKLIAEQKTRTVDVGQVNDSVFINNLSIGIHSRAIRIRQQYTTTFFKKSKIFKMLLTLINIFKPLPLYRVSIHLPKKHFCLITALVFVGNNLYKTDLTHFGEREELNSGELSLFVLKCQNRLELIKFAYHILFNHIDLKNYIEQFTAEQFNIDAMSKMVNVAMDGELLKIQAPLRFKSLHNGLRVFSATPNPLP